MMSPEHTNGRSPDVLLRASGVSKCFAGVQALADARFELRAGEIHALIGENGAGKSTFGKILAGVFRPDTGEFSFAGQPFSPSNPQRSQMAGLAMIFQELDLFAELSVAENIAIANHACREQGWVRRTQLADFCQPYLEQVGLSVSPARKVGDLPIAEQQLVAIARALSMDARVIVMDESTSALPENAVENLFVLMDRLKKQGVSIIYVSHKMEEILRVSDRVTVLRDGGYVGTRNAAETDIDELIRMMVGRSVDRRVTNHSHATEEPLLSIEGLCTDRLQSVGLSVHRGEVVGVAGLVGAGRSEVGRAIFGLDRVHSGTISVAGTDYRARAPREAMRRSVGFVPEDRKSMGLMMQMGVRENMTLAALHRTQRGGFVSRSRENDGYNMLKESTRLKTASAEHPVSSLSGGNQQKVLLGRWLLMNPDVLFLDDPTRGVDVGAKEDIYGLIEDLASKGKGVVMVSSELTELLRCCDRIFVLNQGRMTAELVAAETSQEEIMHYAASPLEQLGVVP